MSSLAERLLSGDPDERNAAIEEVAEPVDPTVTEALGRLVVNTDIGTDARTAAAAALGRVPGDESASRLRDLLLAEDAGVRGLAAAGLAGRPGPDSVNALLGVLGDPVNTVRNVAERGLLAMPDVVREHGLARLEELLDHPEPLTRSPAARLIGAVEATELFEPLARVAATDTEWLPRMWATRALGDLAVPGAIDVLAERLAHDDKNRVRAAAAETLGELRHERSRALLKQALDDPDEGVCSAAEDALAELGRAAFDDDD